MKKTLLFGFLLANSYLFAQNVGINTNSPNATLDVVGIPATTTIIDGIKAPNITGDQLKAKDALYTTSQTGVIVYVTSAANPITTKTAQVKQPGFYYFDGSVWQQIMINNSTAIDIGYLVAWTSNVLPSDYLLPLSGGTYNWADYPDFQTLHSSKACQFIASSTATQFTLVNINTSNRTLRGNTTTGTVGGNTAGSVTIAQANLPNVALSGTTNNAGSHTHTLRHSGENDESQGWPASGFNAVWSTDRTGGAPSSGAVNSSGDHNHTFSTSSINGGVAQSALNIQDPYADVTWCIRVKQGSNIGSVTVNNINPAAGNALTASGSTINWGGAMNQNTTVAQGAYTTAFTSTATNAFSIDGTTFSVDAANNWVGIGTITPQAVLDVASTTSGFLPPRMTTAQRNAIASPPAGSVIYNTEAKVLQMFNGTSWEVLNHTSGNTSSTSQQIITSSDGALSVRAATTNGNLQVKSNRGGTWSASWVGAWNSSGGGGGNITLQSANIDTWSTGVGGSWTLHGATQILHIRNESENKLYRVTRFISSGYANCQVIIELLN